MEIEYYVIQHRFNLSRKTRWRTNVGRYPTRKDAEETKAYLESQEKQLNMPTTIEYRICAAVRTVRLVPLDPDRPT